MDVDTAKIRPLILQRGVDEVSSKETQRSPFYPCSEVHRNFEAMRPGGWITGFGIVFVLLIRCHDPKD